MAGAKTRNISWSIFPVAYSSKIHLSSNLIACIRYVSYGNGPCSQQLPRAAGGSFVNPIYLFIPSDIRMVERFPRHQFRTSILEPQSYGLAVGCGHTVE